MIDFKKTKSILMLGILLGSANIHAATKIDDISGATYGKTSIEITRLGDPIPLKIDKIRLDPDPPELKTGDIIELKNLDATITLRTDSGDIIKLYQGSHPDNKIILGDKTAQPVSEKFWHWLKQTFQQPDSDPQKISAAAFSRSAPDCSNTDTDITTAFALPFPPQNQLNSRHTQLIIPWQGGLPPYTVSLIDAQGNTHITQQEKNACETRFTTPKPGNYTLSIQDAKQAKLQIELHISDTAAPSTPSILQNEALPEPLHSLYYLTWLSQQPHWALESIQLAQTMRQHTAIQDWIKTWGGGPYKPKKLTSSK